jgi:23S rRNA (cytosine1962-C5)-methyltransferase
LEQAIELRKNMTINSDTYRLVNAESDGLPGIIVDRYNEFLVCQFLSAGAEFWKQEIVGHLAQLLSPVGIYERSDTDARLKEGLLPCTGTVRGDDPPELLKIREHDLHFFADIRGGHKTGFYSDQRDNRAMLSHLAKGKDILNCFSYTGGFGVWAMAYGAKTVVNADASAPALEISKKNFELNRLDLVNVGHLQEDVFQVLRKFRDSGKNFDMIILDPPKFVESKSQMDRGARGYKDINLLAFKLLRPGGILMTFSCSGLITPELFQKIVSDAALDAGQEVHILQRLFQAQDHTVSLNFPEGLYLKGLLCKVQSATCNSRRKS